MRSNLNPVIILPRIFASNFSQIINFVIAEPVFATQFRIIGTVTKTFDFKLGVKSNALY